MKTVQLAVRDFALPVPRRGSIDVHSGYSLLNQGQEIHEYIQQKRKKEYPYYRSEVKTSHTFERESYKFVVSGRIDGIFDSVPVLIEEIKSTVNIHQLKAKLELSHDHPYILQAQTYAYLHYLQHGLMPHVRLHLVSTSNYQHSEDLDVKVDLAMYEAWLDKRLDELVVEMQTLEADIMRRIEISGILEFPFKNPRQGQIELMASVEQSIKDAKPLMVQAATGLGKTMAITFPTLKNALSKGQKLVYVTPKNSQHSVAEDALEQLTKQAQNLHALTLTAKSKICFKPEPICTPEYCEYARDYYTKVDEHKLINLMASKPHLNFETLQEIGQKYEVCPFELSVDAIGRADVVVGDYNYVFSPRSLLGRLTQLNDLIHEKPNLVIDEAHNLADRACDYYSPSLNTLTFEDAYEATKILSPTLAIEVQVVLSKSIEIIETTADKKKEAQITLDIEKFKDHDRRWKELLARYLQSGQLIENRDKV
ncbi:MAG: DEAD/DEAH box helicase family protein, partial [Candidatus Obscuribacterales bacterium]|nr:DEAD/DEAH box helicase family protein [Candidatus Obscuribacterales bacterium]